MLTATRTSCTHGFPLALPTLAQTIWGLQCFLEATARRCTSTSLEPWNAGLLLEPVLLVFSSFWGQKEGPTQHGTAGTILSGPNMHCYSQEGLGLVLDMPAVRSLGARGWDLVAGDSFTKVCNRAWGL